MVPLILGSPHLGFRGMTPIVEIRHGGGHADMLSGCWLGNAKRMETTDYVVFVRFMASGTGFCGLEVLVTLR